MNTNTPRYRLVIIAVISAALAAAALSFLVPVAPTVTDALKAHLRTGAAVILATVFIGTAIWFWKGLANFRTRFRIAYILVGAGLVLFGLAMLQLPVFGLFDLWRTPWASGGGAILVFLLSIIPMYLGTRQLARLLEVKHAAGSLWLVSLGAVVAGGIAGAISPAFIRHDLVGAPVYIGAMWATVPFLFASGTLSHLSRRALGLSYGDMLGAQTTSFVFLGLAAINEATVVTFMPNSTTFYSVYGVYLCPFIIAGCLFLRTCYYFHLFTAAYTPSGATGGQASALSDQDYIDSIVNVANLVSRMDQIDPILDRMRQITARHTEGRGLTAKDKDQLVTVYRELEAYLVNDDPVRKFTRQQVLDHVTPGFTRLVQPA